MERGALATWLEAILDVESVKKIMLASQNVKVIFLHYSTVI